MAANPIQRHKLATHPVRRAILSLYAEERDLRASAVDLLRDERMRHTTVDLEPHDALNTVSHHARVLEASGVLVEVDREQIRGGVKRIFSLTENGREFIDGQDGLLGANVVLDRMALVIAQRRREKADEALAKLADMVGATGRYVGAPVDTGGAS